MRLSFPWTVGISVGALACSNPESAPNSSATSRSSSAPTVVAAPSTSQAAGAANRVGELSLPRTDQPWTDVEMKSAARTLDGAGASRLPRKGSAVFDRMVSKENYAFISRTDLTMKQRFPQGGELMSGLSQLLKLYVAGMLSGEKVQREVLELQVAATCASSDMVPLVDEFVATLDPKDPTYPVRMGGLEKVKNGLAEVVTGGLMNLGDKSFSAEDRRWCALASLPCSSKLLPMLKPESRRGATKMAGDLAAAEQDPEVIAALKDFLKVAELTDQLESAKKADAKRP